MQPYKQVSLVTKFAFGLSILMAIIAGVTVWGANNDKYYPIYLLVIPGLLAGLGIILSGIGVGMDRNKLPAVILLAVYVLSLFGVLGFAYWAFSRSFF